MIGPNLRKALRWAAVVIILYGVFIIAMGLVEHATRPPEVEQQDWRQWMSLVAGLAGALVQGGILLALLSIDERLERRA